MYKSVSHIKLVQICTKLSLTVSWYTGTGMYSKKSLSHKKLLQIRINLSLTVQIFLPLEAGTNVYKSLPHSKLVQVYTVQISL